MVGLEAAISYLVHDPKTNLFFLFRRQEMTTRAPAFPGSGCPSLRAAARPRFSRGVTSAPSSFSGRPRYTGQTGGIDVAPSSAPTSPACNLCTLADEKVLLQRRFMTVAIACFKQIKKHPFEFKRVPMNTVGFTDYQSPRLHSSCQVNSRPYALPELGCL